MPDCPDCGSFLKDDAWKCMCGWREKDAPKTDAKCAECGSREHLVSYGGGHLCARHYMDKADAYEFEPTPSPQVDPAQVRAHLRTMRLALK